MAFDILEIIMHKLNVFSQFLNIMTVILSLVMMAVTIYFCAFMSYMKNWPFRILWSLALCYIIFACVYDSGGVINWFLSLSLWQPLARISYAIILIEQMLMKILLQNAQEFSTFAFVSGYLRFESKRRALKLTF